MKAIATRGWGLRPELCLADYRRPTPGPEDLLVKVHAASVNPKDLKINLAAAALATPIGMRRLPPIFGDDLAGTVVARGERVTDFSVGDAVFGMDIHPRTASLAEFAIIDQRRVALKPERLSFQQAAAMPLAALTALQGLRMGQAARGQSVLVIGASGGVGTFAVQIAKANGCRVTAVCSGRNRELVQALGADRTIDYTVGDFRQNAGRFDLVFDATSYETPASARMLREPGAYFISTGGHWRSAVSVLTARDSTARMVKVESHRRDLETLSEMVASGDVRPVIDSTFDLSDSERAYQRSRSGRARGKIVIIVGDAV